MRTSVTSEGAAVIGVNQWQGIRFRAPTDGLRVGVIDLGFKGYEGLRGSELPPEDRLITRSFRDDGDLEGDDEHGAAVAEIIHDIEDSATIYLAAVETVGDINEAITYFIDNRVDVINMSLGCVGCGPGDGQGDAIDVVERAPANDIPFVTSAGNEADRHWIGTFADADGDGLHDFVPGDESNTFSGEAGDEVIIVMNWDFDNWFVSAQDLDLLLLDAQGNVIDQSRSRQAGLAGQEAVEEIVITLPFDGIFHVVVQRIQTSAPQEFELFVEASDLEYVVAERSLTVPADGVRIIAVGAARFSNDVPEGFSSQGPTKDGRMKPEMAAPDGVSTASFGPMGFFGTSAASPHVVGAVALLRGRLGLLSGTDAFQVLTPRLFDLPPNGPDNISGGGRLSLIPPS
jgi:subtilisin family serine protease